jgi:hypothetical protein
MLTILEDILPRNVAKYVVIPYMGLTEEEIHRRMRKMFRRLIPKCCRCGGATKYMTDYYFKKNSPSCGKCLRYLEEDDVCIYKDYNHCAYLHNWHRLKPIPPAKEWRSWSKCKDYYKKVDEYLGRTQQLYIRNDFYCNNI